MKNSRGGFQKSMSSTPPPPPVCFFSGIAHFWLQANVHQTNVLGRDIMGKLQSNWKNIFDLCLQLLKLVPLLMMMYTIKWGNIEQSYHFHGNSLNSVYNSHVARCLWLRLITESFCLNDSFQTKKFDAVRQSFNWNLISPNMSGDT